MQPQHVRVCCLYRAHQDIALGCCLGNAYKHLKVGDARQLGRPLDVLRARAVGAATRDRRVDKHRLVVEEQAQRIEALALEQGEVPVQAVHVEPEWCVVQLVLRAIPAVGETGKLVKNCEPRRSCPCPCAMRTRCVCKGTPIDALDEEGLAVGS